MLPISRQMSSRFQESRAVPLPSFLHTLSPVAGGAEQEKEKVLALCKHCSAAAKKLMCCQHGGTNPKHSTVHYPSYLCTLLYIDIQLNTFWSLIFTEISQQFVHSYKTLIFCWVWDVTFLPQFYRNFRCIEYITIENNYVPLTIIMRNNWDVFVTCEAILQYCSNLLFWGGAAGIPSSALRDVSWSTGASAGQ